MADEFLSGLVPLLDEFTRKFGDRFAPESVARNAAAAQEAASAAASSAQDAETSSLTSASWAVQAAASAEEAASNSGGGGAVDVDSISGLQPFTVSLLKAPDAATARAAIGAAPLVSADLQGTPTAATAPRGNATTRLATTAFVADAVSGLGSGGGGGPTTADQITDATTTGKAVLRAATAVDARTAIGAGTPAPAGTTAVPGLLELATTSEATTGTDTTRAVTPAGSVAVADARVAAAAPSLKDRAGHTGSQALSTVTGLQPALDGKQDSLGVGTSIAGTPDSKKVLWGDGSWRRPTNTIFVWWVTNAWVWPGDGTVDTDPTIARIYDSEHDATATTPTYYNKMFDRWNQKRT